MTDTNNEPLPSSPNPSEPDGRPVDPRRRSLLTGGAALAAGGLIGATATAASADGGYKQQTTIFECATLGETIRAFRTFAMLPQRELDQGDVAGSPFFAMGYLYAEGAIKGGGFIPTKEDSIGYFLCRGHMLTSPVWPSPHLMTCHEYYFGELTEFPLSADMLTSVGPEGDNNLGWTADRAITGGTGIYRGVRGQLSQTQIATNTTLLPDGNPAPCFRFEVDMDVPS